MDKIKYLSRIQLFGDLDLEELKKYESVTPMKVVKKGTIISSPHMDQKILYLIKSGKVRLYRLTESGKEFTVDILETGHVFGEIGTFTTGSENLYAEAWENSVICRIDRVQFEKIIRENPSISLKLLEIISSRLKEVEELLEYMAYSSARKRLLFLLNKLTEKFGDKLSKSSPGDWIALDIHITHQELAMMMGSIRETVSALLNELNAEGIVRKAGRRGTMEVHSVRLKCALKEEG
ncbi:Crp/Fnr family transcriptional regulator [Cytobacillus oceanisediminis]|uniref:Crp/Fnr family transcriptional regulator n=1 Tax=Cytobacillus oceanisediminis TaxID=665099 RepID=UPI0023DBAE01|nr:Crp/Fnr family transcriptional regulator [Cytobacillus oceanisediminis]MDF2036440.1 Crp/Fnr family transcriptional regulator [Cytobacillus oceanisediminis]